MNQRVIENPAINSPHRQPTRHLRFTAEGIMNEEIEGRRVSSCFVPIACPRKRDQKRLQFEAEQTQDRIEENRLVNDVRRRVGLWGKGGYLGIAHASLRLPENPPSLGQEGRVCL